MNRQAARELLVDYLNGHLKGEEKERLGELLRTDDDLRLEKETMEREGTILRAALSDPIEDARLVALSSRVMNELRGRREGDLGALPLPWRSYMRAAAVVFLVVVGLVLFFLLRPGEPTGVSERADAGSAVMQQAPPPKVVRMSFATDDPKVQIHWTFSEDFELDDGGE